eukprot:GHRQ01012220.1.p1 GENE.GHRQ01012220.1~~GHRQ01012220.1.p1  ORF type:complete len:172 (+),score=45.17 GHRQ01012220.1:1780-2295(+)
MHSSASQTRILIERGSGSCDGSAPVSAADSSTSSMQWLHSSREMLDRARRPLWQSGIMCASLACIIFSFSSLQVKLTGGRVPVLQLCIIRSSLSFCTSIAAGTASGIKPLFGRRQHFPLLFLRGFFGTLAISTSYLALLSLPLGDAVTIAQVGVGIFIYRHAAASATKHAA